MPNAVLPAATTEPDRVKQESAVSSAAASPAPSVASSKDDKQPRTTKSTGDAKDKDGPEEDSTDADSMDVDKKPLETGDVTETPQEQSEYDAFFLVF